MTIQSIESSSTSQQGNPASGVRNLLRFAGLSASREELPEIVLKRVASVLRGLESKAVIALRLHDGDAEPKRKVYALHVAAGGAELRPELQATPTLSILCRRETFHELMSGAVSPVEAYLDGRLHLQGDVALAKRIAQLLPHDGEVVSVCPILDGEQWVSSNGYGALTLSGFNFTPFAQADVHYDWGGGQYRQLPFTDAQGRFQVTQSGIPCGPIPGRADGAGVIVSAYDLATGQGLITGPVAYQTPC
jgi:hypothetical protein